MKFKFKIQQYQTEAVENTVNVFAGQPSHRMATYRRDVGRKQQQQIHYEEEEAGYRNARIELDEQTLLDVFAGVPQFTFDRALLEGEGVKAVDLTAEHTQCFASKGEMRKLTQGGGVSINKEKLSAFDRAISTDDLLDNKYLLVQQGKKKYFLLIAK